MLSQLTKQSLKRDQNFGSDAMDDLTKNCTKSLLKLYCFFDMIFEGFWLENGMILVSIWNLISFSATQRRHFRTLASPRISLGASLSVQGRQKCAKCRHKTTWKRPIVKHKQFYVTCETWNSCVLNIKLQFSLTSVHEKRKMRNGKLRNRKLRIGKMWNRKLQHRKLRVGNLRSANGQLQNRKLRNGKQRNQKLRNGKLRNRKPRTGKMRMETCEMEKCEIQNCEIEKCEIQNCEMENCEMENCEMENCEIEKCEIENCDTESCE